MISPNPTGKPAAIDWNNDGHMLINGKVGFYDLVDDLCWQLSLFLRRVEQLKALQSPGRLSDFRRSRDLAAADVLWKKSISLASACSAALLEPWGAEAEERFREVGIVGGWVRPQWQHRPLAATLNDLLFRFPIRRENGQVKINDEDVRAVEHTVAELELYLERSRASNESRGESALKARNQSVAFSSPANGASLKDLAGISDESFRAIRAAAGISTALRGGAAQQKIYTMDEIDRMISAVREGRFRKKDHICNAWKPFSSRG